MDQENGMKTFGEDDKPEIDYPCEWTYKILGRAEEELRSAVEEIVQEEYSLQHSNTSKNGNYLSLELVLTVRTEEERQRIGRQLHAHDAVLFVF